MKQKITLAALMFLVALFAFGQKPEIQKNENEYIKSLADKRQKHSLFPKQIFPNKKLVKFNSVQEYKKRLDSTVSVMLNQDYQFVNEEKNEYVYDANYNLTHFINLNWNDSTNEWINFHKEDYAYDDNGVLTLNIWYNWIDSTNHWKNLYKREYTNNPNGSLASRLNYMWRENTNQWDVSSKYEYTYDGNGNLTQENRFNWHNTNEWRKSYQDAYTYDDNDNLLLLIGSYWSSSGNQWIANTKKEYLYDNSENLNKFITYFWDESVNHWIPSSKEEYSYNEYGNLIHLIDSEWDGNNNQWAFYSKDDYTYDEEGSIKYVFWSNWDEDTNQWVIIFKNEFIYDLTYSFSELLLPFSFYYTEPEFYYAHMLTDLKGSFWNPNANQWISYYNTTLYYSDLISGISDIYYQSLTTYPNPADDFIVFDLANNLQEAIVEIYDFQGRKVLEEKLSADKEISVNHLNSGMYFYRLGQNEKSYTGKFIVK